MRLASISVSGRTGLCGYAVACRGEASARPARCRNRVLCAEVGHRLPSPGEIFRRRASSTFAPSTAPRPPLMMTQGSPGISMVWSLRAIGGQQMPISRLPRATKCHRRHGAGWWRLRQADRLRRSLRHRKPHRSALRRGRILSRQRRNATVSPRGPARPPSVSTPRLGLPTGLEPPWWYGGACPLPCLSGYRTSCLELHPCIASAFVETKLSHCGASQPWRAMADRPARSRISRAAASSEGGHRAELCGCRRDAIPLTTHAPE